MSFQPVIPMGGYAGWQFLTRTLASQQAAFNAAPAQQRDTDHFAAAIGQITTVDQLMADPRLLNVALGAFGLGDRAGAKALIAKSLGSNTSDSSSLVNTLSDKRFLAMAQAFGFGDGTPHTGDPGFANRIIAAYQAQQFATAVGTQDSALQLALQTRSSLANLATSDMSDAAKWYSVLGSPSLRQVFETAYGLPSSFVGIDIDRQLSVMEEKTQDSFGANTVSQFGTPDKMDALIKRFLVRSDIQGGTGGTGTSATSIAVQLLGGAVTSQTTSASAGAASILTLFS